MSEYMNYVDVQEDLLKNSALHDVTIKWMNKYFDERWIAHLSQACGAFISDLDLLMTVMISNLNKIMNKRDAESVKRRKKVIKLLRNVCGQYFDVMVYEPVINKAAELSVKAEAWSTTCIDCVEAIDEFKLFCDEYDIEKKPRAITQRFDGDVVINDLLNENISKLQDLNDALMANGYIERGDVILFNLNYESVLSKGQQLAGEYAAGVEKFKAYNL